jgi:hypothetical protein
VLYLEYGQTSSHAPGLHPTRGNPLEWSGFSEIIFEKGASLHREEQSWCDRTTDDGQTYPSPESFTDPTGLSPVLVKYNERLIGSIRRDCLDHVIVLHE